MNLIRYPDPILNKVSKEATKDDLPSIAIALPGMQAIMESLHGVGLAAVQVGILGRFAILDLQKDPYYDPSIPRIKVIINPEIINYANPVRSSEGCLSLPLYQTEVDRPSEITVKYRDENFVEHTSQFSGLIAQCIQHELDHMNGMLLNDHDSVMKQQMYKKKLSKRGIL